MFYQNKVLHLLILALLLISCGPMVDPPSDETNNDNNSSYSPKPLPPPPKETPPTTVDSVVPPTKKPPTTRDNDSSSTGQPTEKEALPPTDDADASNESLSKDRILRSPPLDRNRRIPKPQPINTLQRASSNMNEQYIHRWSNIEGVNIDNAINDLGGSGKLWFVGACIAEKDKPIELYQHYFYESPQHIYHRYTNNILFNWLHRTYASNSVWTNHNYYTLHIPLPLIVPLKNVQDMYPYDPAIVYKANSIDIIYQDILDNTFNPSSIGNLTQMNTWQDIRPESQSGDLVDIVIYIYQINKSYEWFDQYMRIESSEAIINGLKTAHVTQVIVLQRLSILLQ